ncbi:MAG: agmatine deiminase family protein, partial [Gammaproteobacteria bacterium]
VENVYQHIVKEIARHEQVLIVHRDQSHKTHITALIGDADILNNCVFAQADSNDSWSRDHGPITILKQGKPVLLNYIFNGWGNKFSADMDTLINDHLYRDGIFATTMETYDFVLEGGSIDTDGQNSLLTTEYCLLSPERNPTYSKAGIEQLLKQHMGVEQILWLKHGYLAGDDTDSHIDTLAKFCNENTIVYCSCNPDDEHYEELSAMEQELRQLRNIEGRPYKLVALPIPAARFDDDQHRLPATYINYLIINGAILLPVYDDPNDQIAIDRLAEIYPDREIVPINCLPIIEQHGSLHCLTMQLPKGVLKPC